MKPTKKGQRIVDAANKKLAEIKKEHEKIFADIAKKKELQSRIRQGENPEHVAKDLGIKLVQPL